MIRWYRFSPQFLLSAGSPHREPGAEEPRQGEYPMRHRRAHPEPAVRRRRRHLRQPSNPFEFDYILTIDGILDYVPAEASTWSGVKDLYR